MLCLNFEEQKLMLQNLFMIPLMNIVFKIEQDWCFGTVNDPFKKFEVASM